MDDLMPELEPHAFGRERGKKSRQMSKMSKKISQSTSKAIHDEARSVQYRPAAKRPNLIAMSQAKTSKPGIPDMPPSSGKANKK